MSDTPRERPTVRLEPHVGTPDLTELLEDILGRTSRARRRPGGRIPAWWLPMRAAMKLEAEPWIARLATRLLLLVAGILAVATMPGGSY